MADFIDKDAFLKDVLPDCQFQTLLLAAVERQPIVHIDDMVFKIQYELKKANPSGVMEITFVRQGRWIRLCDGKYYCSECQAHLGNYRAYCGKCGAKMDLTEETKKEDQRRACTTCAKRTRCPAPASGRAQTGCTFWTAEEADQDDNG